ncbi:MAG: hypothetical protein JKP92_01840 [Alphaproteobacteria bacterium]|nr:hypothetical protein [Alphaproteobacteria bacterium]
MRVLALSVALVLAAGSAPAAFEYTPPPAQEARPPVSPAPAPRVSAVPLPPVSAGPAPRMPREASLPVPAPIRLTPEPQARVSRQAVLPAVPTALTPAPADMSAPARERSKPEPVLIRESDLSSARPPQRTSARAETAKPSLFIDPNPLGAGHAHTPVAPRPSAHQQGLRGGHAVQASRPLVQGFGKNIPLGLALAQVVPARYAYDFAPGTADKMGARVSWEGGGRPWEVVARDMLAPLGLTLHIQGDAVVIAAR